MKRVVPPLADLMDELDRAPLGELAATIRQLAAQYAGVPGLSFATLRKKYYRWKEKGHEGLIDGRTNQEHACDKWRFSLLEYESKSKSVKAAWAEMMSDFRSGKKLSGKVSDWKGRWREERPLDPLPKACPPDWTPIGASYQNLIKASRTWLYLKKRCGHELNPHNA